MTEHTLNFSFQARYFTLGDETRARQVWFVLHGYGQLAKYFIKKFSILNKHNIFIVAPEGLSRFYLEDVTRRAQSGNQRVGASWMTREDRLSDINNYLNFLESVYRKEVDGLNLPVTVLGFSQGAATASRWVTTGTVRFDRLILWGGVFPTDLDLPSGKQALKNKQIIFVNGTEDPFLKQQGTAEIQPMLEKIDVHPHVIQYTGGHDIDESTLLQLV